MDEAFVHAKFAQCADSEMHAAFITANICKCNASETPFKPINKLKAWYYNMSGYVESTVDKYLELAKLDFFFVFVGDRARI